MIGRIRHKFDCFYRVANLMVPISNELDSLGGLLVVLVKPSSESRSHPGKQDPEQHLDRKTIGCSVEVEESKSIHCFSEA